MNTVAIVLNYNDSQTTKKFINNIEKYKCIDKIIVVDNNSSDNSYQVLSEQKNNKIDVIKTNKNNGYASGNNFGIKYAEEKYNPEYVIISNPDVEFEERIIDLIKKIMEKDNTYALGTCTMKESGNTRNLAATRVGGYYHILMSTFPIMGKMYNNKLIKYPSDFFKSEYSEVECIPGSFFIAKLDKIKEVNYLDEDTFLYCEEEILGFKLKQSNYKAIILNNEVYYHYHSVSINKSIKSNQKKHIILQKSREIYLKKYLKINKVKFYIFKLISFLALKERYFIESIKNMMRVK